MFQALIECSDSITIVTDQNLKVRYISSAVEKMLGIEAADFFGRKVSDIFTFASLQTWETSFKKNHSFSDEAALSLKDGSLIQFKANVFSLQAYCNCSDVAIQLHEVTDTKLRETELIRSNQQLDQVIYKTTHDLKAPLMSALGLVNLAEKATAVEKDKYIELIRKSLLNLDSFIEEMNVFFRNEKLAVQREFINVADLLRQEIENLSNVAGDHNPKVYVEVKGDFDFYSDSIRIKTILTNILSNAIKYSDHKKNEPFIKVLVLIDEDYCDISVVDNGIGIDSGLKDRIFDLFFRATTQSQGTGLGLFIVKDTIQKLKGSIEVDSTLGKGTTFLIRIPNQIRQPIEVE
jgi:PAS domain S-box-containing protein